MNTRSVREILDTTPVGTETAVNGWVRTKRDSKNVCFLELNDGSSMKSLQLIVDKGTDTVPDELLERITTGASLTVTGEVVESPGKNQRVEMHVKGLELYGEAPAESYPLQKKRHSFEFLREIAHLRPRTNTFGAVARVRNTLSMAIHNFFQSRGFMYVHTPIITASDAEGAGEMFQVTTLPLNELPVTDEGIDYTSDFFGKRTSLTVSGQLEAEIFATALSKVYTFGPTFRAENSNTSRHLAEFWMIEPEVAFCDITGNMDLAEDFLKSILAELLERSGEDMEFFDKWIEKGLIENLTAILESDFARISYTEAIEALQDNRDNFEFSPDWGADLQSEHEKYLTETVYKRPVIVSDYPREIKAFYMKLNEDGKTVRAMDVLVPRLGEIIGGSEREADHNVLLNRIREQGLDEKEYWWYLDLRRFGTVPHAGFGLGFERLVQYVTGMQNIRDVIPFPRTPHSADF
ncbi:MAG: asparagine--tRNA ligase [Spirochaetia bacterium]